MDETIRKETSVKILNGQYTNREFEAFCVGGDARRVAVEGFMSKPEDFPHKEESLVRYRFTESEKNFWLTGWYGLIK
jgi:hypothetical protein